MAEVCIATQGWSNACARHSCRAQGSEKTQRRGWKSCHTSARVWRLCALYFPSESAEPGSRTETNSKQGYTSHGSQSLPRADCALPKLPGFSRQWVSRLTLVKVPSAFRTAIRGELRTTKVGFGELASITLSSDWFSNKPSATSHQPQVITKKAITTPARSRRQKYRGNPVS
jgi:hypothetical protein